MAVRGKHQKVLSVPDGADTSVVRPSDWNADILLYAGASSLLGNTAGADGQVAEVALLSTSLRFVNGALALAKAPTIFDELTVESEGQADQALISVSGNGAFNYSGFILWDSAYSRYWMFTHRSAAGEVNDFAVEHYDGTSYRLAFQMKSAGNVVRFWGFDAWHSANLSFGAGLTHNTGTGVLAVSAGGMARMTNVLSANVASTSTTLAVVTGWTYAMTAGKKYRVRVMGAYQTAATTTGASIGWVSTGGFAGTVLGVARGAIATTAAATELSRTITNGVNSLTTTGVSAANTPHHIQMELVVSCTTSGTFQIAFGSEVAGSQALLLAGSALEITEL